MKLSVIIVNWNIIEVLRGCLDSLRTHLEGLAYEVIVVDNASADHSVEILRRDYPWAHLIVNDHNLGFAAANNQAFRIAQGEYLLILNPDTVIHQGSIQRLMGILEHHPAVGIAGPRLVNAEGRIDTGCRRTTPTLFSTLLNYFLVNKLLFMLAVRWGFFGKRYFSRFYSSGRTRCVLGACMLVRKKELDAIGYFDEQVPMYLDDIDLCYRFRKKGFTIYYCADSEVIHLESKSAKKSGLRKLDIIMIQAEQVFFKKHFNRFYVFAHRFIICFSSLVWMVVDCLFFIIFACTSKRATAVSLLNKHAMLFTVSLTGRFVNLSSLKY